MLDLIVDVLLLQGIVVNYRIGRVRIQVLGEQIVVVVDRIAAY